MAGINPQGGLPGSGEASQAARPEAAFLSGSGLLPSAMPPTAPESASADPALRQQIRIAVRRTVGIGVLAFMLTALVMGIILAQEHSRGLAAARERTQGAARSYAVSLTTLLTHVEVLLQGLRLTVADPGTSESSTPLTEVQIAALLSRFKAADSMMMDFLLIRPDGTVGLWTGPGEPPPVDDREYFLVHRNQPDHGLYLGAGMVSRAYLGEWFFPMSLRLSGPDGQFLGVLMVSIDLQLVRRRLALLQQDDSEILTVTDPQGVILARLPGGLDLTRRTMPNPLYPDTRKTERTEGAFRDPLEPLSAGERVITYRKVERFPLVVSASLPVAVVLESWYRGLTYAVGFTALSALLIVLAVVWTLRAQILRLKGSAELDRSRQALEREHHLGQTVLDTMPVQMFIRDTNGTYLRCNRAFRDGSPVEDVVGRHVLDLQPGEDGLKALQTDQDVIRTGAPVQYEFTSHDVMGDEHHMMITKVPLRAPDGTVAAVIGTAVDISERRTMELSLQAERDRAEQALLTLQEAQTSLIRSEKLASLGSLVAGIAHEVNTPVGVSLTGASHLEKEVAALQHRLDERSLTMTDLQAFLDTAKEATALLVSSNQRAADLIHSFKQVAVDQTSGHRRVFRLAEYIDEVLLSLRPKFKKTRHRVMVDCPPDLEMDSYPGALSQVLTNLLINSLIHGFAGREDGDITIAVKAVGGAADRADSPADRIEMLYKDNGIGIRPEVLPRVFDPFFTTRRGAGGSGLGLNIVYNIVVRTLGGTVDLQSSPGNGVCFLIRVPRRTAEVGKGTPG